MFFDVAIQPRFFVDPGYGVRGVQANIDTRHYVPGDYDVRVTTNSAGMRGQREYAVQKPSGTIRTLVVGDSMGFGFGVEDDEVVSAVLERLLNEQGGSAERHEVLNQSVSGTGQAEQLVAFHARFSAYQPDTVVLLYFDNDIGNNSVSGVYEASGDTAVHRTSRSFLPGVRVQQVLYAAPPIRWLFEHSTAWNLIRNQLSSIVQRQLLKTQGLRSYQDGTPEAIALTRALIRQFAADAQAIGAQLILVIIPARPRMTSNFPMTPEEFAQTGGLLVDGRDFLTVQDYFVSDSHICASGHAKIAERLKPLIAAH